MLLLLLQLLLQSLQRLLKPQLKLHQLVLLKLYLKQLLSCCSC